MIHFTFCSHLISLLELLRNSQSVYAETNLDFPFASIHMKQMKVVYVSMSRNERNGVLIERILLRHDFVIKSCNSIGERINEKNQVVYDP